MDVDVVAFVAASVLAFVCAFIVVRWSRAKPSDPVHGAPAASAPSNDDATAPAKAKPQTLHFHDQWGNLAELQGSKDYPRGLRLR